MSGIDVASCIHTPEPTLKVIAATIDYAHDSLYRLTAADYDSGEFFHYN